MEDKQVLAGNERAVSVSQPPSGSKRDADDAEAKRPNCLCAPTTHAGSFRCRLHRKPPPSPVSSQLAAKRGFSAQKMSSPKVKLALQHKLKPGCNRKMPVSSCSTSSRLEQELPKLSRLSRTSIANDENQSSSQNQEAILWKSSFIAGGSREEPLESAENGVASDARDEEIPSSEENPSSEEKRYIRPLVKLPSI
ncbi:hypothetical protein GOP47_0023462 [Adiantum capillus-veneris]|uniref:Uncharacterized protein n=1 Tax=Adiantum capillus-veneris TaxID=13818 RepID=A0A9D4U4K6_ADICA|nr:hypothetical protein GOP47_0023462 [Adiantum capillus-veneris]